MRAIPLYPPPISQELGIEAFMAAVPAEREAVYQSHVFPFSAQRLAQERPLRARCDLVLIPVGMQAYAPLLAAAANPAARLALLHTDGSEAVRDVVAASLEHWPPSWGPAPAIASFRIGSGLSGEHLCRAVDAALLWAEDPWPIDVMVDVTGGLKATASMLGAVSGARGLRSSYIASEVLLHPFQYRERWVGLADVRSLFPEDDRVAGVALLEEGVFMAAAERLGRARSELATGPALGWLVQLAELLANDEDPGSGLAGLAAQLPECEAREVLERRRGERVGLARGFVDALRRQGAWR